ncbi:hypothetical protein D9758_001178 [Tetrapyrgos nigripes]|uniref:uracil phosphoribosyltransferase n=1 Tax=Tetrapyrgos nigripes TaxID=182062 RepID=A0A8H5GRC8_9AGAR|nr:hypothetical protein D9758_001178 [Tetrapyrgos nigripes]
MSSKVHTISHPVVNAQLSKLRQSSTSPKEFREGIHNIGLILGLEASRNLEQESFEGQSPVSSFKGTVIKPRIGLTPILRAGQGMTDALLTLFPTAPVYHLGLFREKVSLQPVEYYSRLPSVPPVDIVYLLDPMIATGGTVLAAASVKNIKLLSVLASREGLNNVKNEHPDLEIWVAAIDETLTPEGYISPGLGDAGDRIFNTIRP